jgi:hypothetical protein
VTGTPFKFVRATLKILPQGILFFIHPSRGLAAACSDQGTLRKKKLLAVCGVVILWKFVGFIVPPIYLSAASLVHEQAG